MFCAGRDSEKGLNMYGCYSTHYYEHHDDGGSGNTESLLMTGLSVDDLRDRYNAYVKGTGGGFRLKYDPVMDPDSDTVSHEGSTGGGLLHSHYTIKIKDIPQVDRP